MRYLALHLGRSLLLVMLTLFVTLSLTILGLTASESGTRWSLNQLAEHWPQYVQLEGVQGTLLDRLQLDRLEISAGGTNTRLQGVEMKWSPADLLQRRLSLDNISAQTVSVILPQPENNTSPSPRPTLPALSLPLQLTVDRLQVEQLNIQQNQRLLATLEGIELSAQWQNEKLDIYGLNVRYENFSAFAEGELAFNEDSGADLRLVLNQKERAGRVTLGIQGPASHYHWQAASTLEVMGSPAYRLNASGTGDLTGLHIDDALLSTLEGEIHPLGQIEWWPELAADIVVTANDINPVELVESLPGKLAVEGELRYRRDALSTRFTGEGQIRDYPVGFAAMAQLQGEVWQLQTVQLVVGDNRLALSGRMANQHQLDLLYLLQAPRLSELYPGLEGELNAEGKLSGDIESPRIDAQISAHQIRFADWQLTQLGLNVQPMENGQHRLDFQARGLGTETQSLQSVQITGEASPDQHSMDLDVLAANQHRLQTHLEGRSDPASGTVQTVISQTRISLKDWLALSQTGTALLNASVRDASLTPLCLSADPTQLCVEGHWLNNGPSRANLTANHFPLAALSRWIPETGPLKDEVSLTAQLRGDGQDWLLTSLLDIDKDNRLQVDASVKGPQQQLEGTVKLAFDRVQWLALFSPAIAPPEGQLSSELMLSGTLTTPGIQGFLRLDNGLLRVPETGTELKAIQLNMAFPDSQRAELTSSLKVGEEILDITGTINWSDLQNPSATLQAGGKRLLLVNTHEARVHVSPNLTLNASRERLDISGRVEIPEARFNPGEIPPSTARVSTDEVIITKTGVTETGPAFPIYAAIDLKVAGVDGKKVIFEGFGLYSELQGQIRLTQRPQKEAQADGNVRIVEGHYKAYGQDLKIERGEVFFNGPLDNPGYSIQAVRRTGDIRAGIRLSGTLDQPQSDLFSDPAMSDTDTLSYLLTGQAFNRQSSGDREANALLLMAATRWGLKAGGGILEDLQAASGFDTLQINAADDLTQSALLVGKYLTPRLYLQYAMRLFEETDVLSLRYQLSPSLQLEAESGSSQGLDLIYQLERD